MTLAGDGELDEMRAAVAAAGRHETIHAVRWLDPAAGDEWLCSAHIFVLPSRDKGLPMALLEAMGYGLVPVTTMVGSAGEAVSDRVTGLIVAPGRPGRIAEVLTALVTDERLRTRLGTAARSRASDFGLDGWYERLPRLRTHPASKQPPLSRRERQTTDLQRSDAHLPE